MVFRYLILDDSKAVYLPIVGEAAFIGTKDLARLLVSNNPDDSINLEFTKRDLDFQVAQCATNGVAYEFKTVPTYKAGIIAPVSALSRSFRLSNGSLFDYFGGKVLYRIDAEGIYRYCCRASFIIDDTCYFVVSLLKRQSRNELSLVGLFLVECFVSGCRIIWEKHYAEIKG